MYALPREIIQEITSRGSIEFAQTLRLTCRRFAGFIEPAKANLLIYGALHGALELCKIGLLRNNDKRFICVLAALHGHVEILAWARVNNFRWDSGVCAAAAGGGHLEVLKWLRGEPNLAAEGHFGTNRPGVCPWNEGTCTHAARKGHLEILKWAREHGCPWGDRTAMKAVKAERVEILEWMKANLGLAFGPEKRRIAICKWETHIYKKAADTGSVKVLAWIRESMLSDDSPDMESANREWEACTLQISLKMGHLEVVKWLRGELIRNIAESRDGVKLSTCDFHIHKRAASHGHLDILKWHWEEVVPDQDEKTRFQWEYRVTKMAATEGHLEVLVWFREARGKQVPEWDMYVCCKAIHKRHFKVLEWLRSVSGDMPLWDKCLSETAASRGCLEVLKWFKDTAGVTYVWSGPVCEAAAKKERLEVLRYLIESGCSWTPGDMSAYSVRTTKYLRALGY